MFNCNNLHNENIRLTKLLGQIKKNENNSNNEEKIS